MTVTPRDSQIVKEIDAGDEVRRTGSLTSHMQQGSGWGK